MFVRHRTCAWLTAASLAFVTAPSVSANERGGAYVIFEVDAARLREEQLDFVADQMASALRDASPAIRYVGRGVVNDAARVRLVDEADQRRALAALRGLANAPETNEEILTFSMAARGVIEARLTPSRITELSRLAALQSIEVIRRRLDQTRMRDAEIAQQGDTRILVRTECDCPDLLRRNVGVTGQMTFHLVREVSPEDAAAGRISPGTMLVQPHPSSAGMAEVVERRPRFTGARLVRANASTDPQTGEWVLVFGLDAEGTRIFCRITRENTGTRFAILLDRQVLTAPRINEPICGGTGQISGNFTAQSVNELVVMLMAGALPAPLIVVEEGVTPARP